MSDIKYNYFDFEECMGWPAYMHLARENDIFFVKKGLDVIESYSKFITLYPQVKCEPLSFLYQCNKAVCAMDEFLLDDFIQLGWRGVVWSSWLCLITPFETGYFHRRLERVKNEIPRGQWIAELAYKSCVGGADHPLIEISDRYRYHISKLPKLEVPLREWPSNEYMEAYKSRHEAVREIYKTQGTDEALLYLSECEKYKWDLTYSQWLIEKSRS